MRLKASLSSNLALLKPRHRSQRHLDTGGNIFGTRCLILQPQSAYGVVAADSHVKAPLIHQDSAAWRLLLGNRALPNQCMLQVKPLKLRKNIDQDLHGLQCHCCTKQTQLLQCKAPSLGQVQNAFIGNRRAANIQSLQC